MPPQEGRRTSLRIVFFGVDGALSLAALGAISSGHQLAGVVRPRPQGHPAPAGPSVRRLLGAAARALGLRPAGTLAEAASRSRAPLWEAHGGDDPVIAEEVRRARPDVICIAGYPWLLRGEILTHPPALTLNVHAALLPRHRGPLPLFWIYHHNDRETGVTVHEVTDRADAGAILGQESFPLPRGFPVERLNRLNAERGAALVGRVLADLAVGRTSRRAQDEALATPAPRVRPGSRMIDFERWGVERVWHFMAGLFPRFVEPLTALDGAPVCYGGVLGYEERETPHPPGSVTPAPYGYDLHCLRGIVRLAP